MKHFPTLKLCLACAGILCSPAFTTAQENTPSDFTPLFNGKNLEGWQRVNTDESTWSVKDGMLFCTGKPIGELRTNRMYQNFILEVEWRHMKPRGNAGIFVWADDITARGVPFHRGIEVQVLENAYGNTRGYTTHGDIFPIHGAKMKPINGRGGSRAFPIEKRSNASPDWNHYRIECRDGDISLAVNGKIVTRGKECSPRKGYICIESEGGVVYYRNMRIKELPATEVAEQHVAIADRGYRCLYTGIDLNAWKANGKWKSQDWQVVYKGNEEGSLSTEIRQDDRAFIVDLRSKKASTATAHWRSTPIPISLGKNKWSRIEATQKENQLTVLQDGKEIASLPISDAQNNTLSITVKSPTDLANVYARGKSKE